MTQPNAEASLESLQSCFFAASTHPESVEAGLAEVASLAVEDLVRAGPRMSARACLEVYRESYASRLVECLADDYPAVQFHLGAAQFEVLAASYVVAHPSRSPSLNYFGREFAAFCRARGDVFVAELAELEWAMVEAIHASDAEALSLERLAQLPADEWALARFTPNASLRLLEFTHPVNAFYQAYRDELPPPTPVDERTWMAVCRLGTSVWRFDLCSARFGLLEQLSRGVPLGEALERAGSRDGVSPDDVLAWFAKWIQDGFFTDIRPRVHPRP
ncbi:MAG TPA: DNA-binding domain-containing protein [Polyangiaceae bacterium]|nr:DNA-binding domain-containing protein [Polyangiaceae bacterium]